MMTVASIAPRASGEKTAPLSGAAALAGTILQTLRFYNAETITIGVVLIADYPA
jgi:hypothetical protein